MARFIYLDSGVLNLSCTVTEPDHAGRFLDWVADAPVRGTEIVIAQVVWFEVCRKLVHKRDLAEEKGRHGEAETYIVLIEALNNFCDRLENSRVENEDWARACALWSWGRRGPKAKGDDKRLEVDAILAAMAANRQDAGNSVYVATNNKADFDRFEVVPAEPWPRIPI